MTSAAATQKDLEKKSIKNIGTDPVAKVLISAATQKDLEKKNSRTMGTDPVGKVHISSSTQCQRKKTKDAGTGTEVKSVASVETSIESGSGGAIKDHSLSSIDARAAQNLSGDMQKTKNIRSEGEEACRLKLKNYEHGIRSALIKKLENPNGSFYLSRKGLRY